MRRLHLVSVLVAACCLCVLQPGWNMAAEPAARRIDFNRDIRPILSNNCYVCHGFDEGTRQADLRLDIRDGATAELPSGETAIVPGKRDESAAYWRITSDDEFEMMPPADSDKELTPEQIELLTRWIDQGAEYTPHWAFIPPKRTEPTATDPGAWARNPIDRFVLAGLQRNGLEPSSEADKETLIRRVSLDLTGLPPTPAEIDAFLADRSPEAYEKVVDRLIASPHFGEHAARYWLDAARYGDTHGLHLDNQRSIWPYRDWVIGALNRNMPFDRFTIEQLAGDLLPEPTLEQRVATGFNRCNVTTSEGGSIDEEVRVRYAVDRVETTGTVWLGLTVGCAVCHDHKFDPVTQKEFYGLFAYFNSTTDKPMDGNAMLPPPSVRVSTPEYAPKKSALERELADLQNRVAELLAGTEYVDPVSEAVPASTEPADLVWIDDTLPAGAKPEGDTPWQFVAAPERPVHAGTKSALRKAAGRSQHYFTGANPPLRVGEGDKLFVHVYLDPADPPREIMLQWNDGSWEHRAYWGEDAIDWGQAGTAGRRPIGPLPEAGKWVRLEVDAAPVGLAAGAAVNGWAFTQFDGTVYWDTAGIVTSTPQGGRQFQSQRAWELVERGTPKSNVPEPVRKAIAVEAKDRTPEQAKLVRDYYLEFVHADSRAVFDPLHAERDGIGKRIAELEKSQPSTLVMQEMPAPRDAFVLHRGEYDKPGEKVARGVPAVLPPLPADAPANRLGLARWLVDPAQPLTARVTVNRFWQRYFGTGLVKTSNDFGSQGEWPSHPELLDWLAVEFVESGWDVKAMQRLIVTSATYRQSAAAGPEAYAADPENRLLARGPRFRMDAEVVRDNALAVSGLLVRKIGGPSVKPYQPAGLWRAVGYTSSNTAVFKQDAGEALYRRGLYTFWKRTSPPPTLLLLDAPSRETCSVRRERTNTPLAALALMNDKQFVEAARALAQRMMREGGDSPDGRAAYGFRLATARQPRPEELAVLTDQFNRHLKRFQENGQAAAGLLAVGDSPRDESLDAGQLAAWTLVANLILNLDETVTKN